jgi:hypothetical protein
MSVMKIGAFPARYPDGKEEWINIFQEFIETVKDGWAADSPGLQYYQTLDGRTVTRRSKGEYEVDGVILQSDSSEAP